MGKCPPGNLCPEIRSGVQASTQTHAASKQLAWQWGMEGSQRRKSAKIPPTGPPGRWARGIFHQQFMFRIFFESWGVKGEVWGIFPGALWAKSLKVT